jgi:hypothetical protein
MNNKQLFWSLLFALQAAACGAQNQRTSISNHNGETEIVIENSKEDLELSYKGELTFNDAETAVQGITPGTKLRYRNGRNKLEISADASGHLSYTCNGGPATAQASAECADMERQVVAMLVRTGVGAKERAARIYAKGGFPAVMTEIDRMPNDYVRSIYIKALMEQPSLSSANWQALATRIQTGISSDYEKAGLLRRLIARSGPDTLPAFFDATASVTSDYEKAGVLNAAFAKKLDAAYYGRAMEVAGAMKSDYEKARVLKTAAAAPGMQLAPLLKAAATIGSDYEKAGVLQQLLPIAGNNEGNWISLLETAKGIKSDYEKASLLVKAAKGMPRTPKVISEYRKTAATISSEYELGRATKAIGTEA